MGTVCVNYWESKFYAKRRGWWSKNYSIVQYVKFRIPSKNRGVLLNHIDILS
jgi:hypothetical protein